MTERTSRRSESNRIGALIIGGLILIVLAVAIFGSIVAKRQLDRAARAQIEITIAQQRLDDLLRTQLDEEATLRESVATKGQVSDPYERIDDPFLGILDEVREDIHDIGLGGGDRLVADLAQTHRQWDGSVALPLRSSVSREQQARLQTYGKTLIDRMESQVLNLRVLLQSRMKDVQDQLGVQIDQTVEYSVGFVLIFALTAVLLSIRGSLTQAQLVREHSIAETFEGALRVGWDPLPQTAIGSSYMSATTEAQVGGDLIDVWRLDETRAFVLIADVSGKGIDAAVNTAFVKYSIRTLACELDDPAQILKRFNTLFIRTIDDPSLFVELFLGVFEAETGTLRYASAGHGSAFLRRLDRVEALPPTGPLVGLSDESEFERADVVLQPGDVLLLSTDGFTEARDQDGTMLDDDAIAELVLSGPAEPQALCDYVVAQVKMRNGGRVTDDLALLAIATARAQASVPVA
jgi:serine phosphatase RsbU (regulator of sigma subunit)